MIDSIKDYWYLWLVLVVLIAVLVIVFQKAMKSAKKKSEIAECQRKQMEKFKSFYEKYKNLDKTLAEKSDSIELAEGVTIVLQYQLEKSVNPDEEYKNAENWRREVYALFYFDEDCKISLSFFFKNNCEPLPSVLMQGLKNIGMDKLYNIASQMYAMYDDNNECVSFDKNKIEELDKKFSEVYVREDYFAVVKNYIISNL